MKKEHTKITKDTVPVDYTVSLCTVDAIPVILFCINCVIIGTLINDLVFIFGALLCLWAGVAKVIWKFIVVLKQKNIWWMFIQLRFVMPIGFVLMITGFALSDVPFADIISNLISFPSVIFFCLAFICYILMTVFAFVLKNKSLNANWIEQITNGFAQAFVFIGLLILV